MRIILDSTKWDSARHGWVDKNGNVWIPDTGDRAHGKDHWDVQTRNGKGYVNVHPGGVIRGGEKPYPNIPPKAKDDNERIEVGPESMPYPEPIPTLGPMPGPAPIPNATPGPMPTPKVINDPVLPLPTAVPQNPVVTDDYSDDILAGGLIIATLYWGIKIVGAFFTNGLTLVLP